MSLRFVVPGEPIAWQRTAQNGSRRFNTAEHEAHRKTLAQYAHLAIRQQEKALYPSGGNFWLGAQFFLGSYMQAGAERGYDRDLDNMLKMIGDALTGIVWRDDKQIQGLLPGTCKVLDCKKPQTWVLIVHEGESTSEELAAWTDLRR